MTKDARKEVQRNRGRGDAWTENPRGVPNTRPPCQRPRTRHNRWRNPGAKMSKPPALKMRLWGEGKGREGWEELVAKLALKGQPATQKKAT